MSDRTPCLGCGKMPDKNAETGEWEQVYPHKIKTDMFGGGSLIQMKQMKECPGPLTTESLEQPSPYPALGIEEKE